MLEAKVFMAFLAQLTPISGKKHKQNGILLVTGTSNYQHNTQLTARINSLT